RLKGLLVKIPGGIRHCTSRGVDSAGGATGACASFCFDKDRHLDGYARVISSTRRFDYIDRLGGLLELIASIHDNRVGPAPEPSESEGAIVVRQQEQIAVIQSA